MKVIECADLHCTLGGADKVYHCAIQEVAGGYTVDFAYGRRCSTLTRGTKTSSGPVSLDKAKQIFSKLISEKTGKGYVNSPGISGIVFAGQMEGGASSTVEAATAAAAEKVSTGIFPQLLNAIDESEVATLIQDPRWGAMEKKDGKRQMVRSDGTGKIIGINRRSFVVPLSPVVAKSVAQLGRAVLLDGESIGDTLHCFGILEYDGTDLRSVPYQDAHRLLVDVLQRYTGDGLELVPLAITSAEKKELYDRLVAKKAEGIVFKRLDMPYAPDRPASGGPHLKRKFTESASVVVIEVNGKRSVKMGVYEGDSKLTFVGSVTIPANHDIPKAGDVIEVEYLYAFLGGSIFQPVYKGLRDDIDPSACRISQLKYRQAEDTEAA